MRLQGQVNGLAVPLSPWWSWVASGQGLGSAAAQMGKDQELQESAEYRPKEEGPRDPADRSQQGRVRDLREKFQALNSTG